MRYLIIFLFSFSFATILYVDGENYTTIQSAIDDAEATDTVFVAEGIYSPYTNGESFPIIMASGIHLIGSGEDISIIDAQQRDRVITMEDCNNNTISDLTLRGGLTDSYGGGMRLDYSDPILSHVTISNNTANWGGGMHSCDSNPILIYVTISNNQALQGGAMRLIESDPILTNVTISNNTASECGGMRLFNSDPIMTHVTISNNTAEYYGGAMWLDYSNPTLTYVTIANNTAEYAGGGMRLSNSNPILTNVTIANNTAGIYGGGGMYLNSSNPNLKNSIMWGNNPESIYIGSGTPLITYSDIEGDWEGEGNIDADPLFTHPDNEDYTLLQNSPCIDSGTTDNDDDGVEDIVEYFGSAPDMGAFEYEPLSIVETVIELPVEYVLHHAYPNPFNSVTTISLGLPEDSRVELEVYNLKGIKINTLTSGLMSAGNHTIEWNAEGYPGGVYFVKLNAGEFTQTQKLMLVK